MGSRKKVVLVTGSLGYIGSVLTEHLGTAGFDCRGLDTGFFRDCLIHPAPRSKTALCDMRDFTASWLEGVDAVVHLAGISNDPLGRLSPAQVYDPTRDYALELARVCDERGIRYIFASSCSVYGRGRGEDLVKENDPLDPQTPYSVNKVEIERGLRAIFADGGEAIVLRFATVYGLSPRMRFDVVVNMFVGMAVSTGRIMLNSDGRAWRPSVHISDVCRSVERAIDHLIPNGGGPLVLNVGDTGDNHRVKNIAEMVAGAVPGTEVEFLDQGSLSTSRAELVRDRKLQDGVDTRTYRVSFERIREVFDGFACEWDIESGIGDLARSLQALGMNQEQMSDSRFYRLQHMEHLHNGGFIDDDLRWTEEGLEARRQWTE